MRSDLESMIKKYKIITFGCKKNFEEASNKLINSETVIYANCANSYAIHKNTGDKEDLTSSVYIFTNKRLIIYCKVHTKWEILNLSDIQMIRMIQVGNKLKSYEFQVNTLAKEYYFHTGYIQSDATFILNLLQKNLNNYKGVNNTLTNANTNNIIEQIEQIANLKSKGIITEEEFNSKKAELLSRL